MAQVTGNQSEDRPEPEEKPSAAAKTPAQSPKVLAYQSAGRRGSGSSTAFFAIYKKGQGYWTRMLTAAGALILLALTAYFLYEQLPATWQVPQKITIVVVLVVIGGLAVWSYRLMNKPSNVDFLIATDSEMKKVNWASRSELIGSTKVVIGFMFLTAVVLFAIDQFLHTFFWLISVLKDKPFFIP